MDNIDKHFLGSQTSSGQQRSNVSGRLFQYPKTKPVTLTSSTLAMVQKQSTSASGACLDPYNSHFGQNVESHGDEQMVIDENFKGQNE